MRNGRYLIDPDGVDLGDPAFEVFCDFIDGSTRTSHDGTDSIEIPTCSGEDCFRRTLSYSASMNQLKSLIELSDSCSQSIRFDCLMAPLNDDGVNYGAWINRDGRKEIYFDGDNHGVHMCRCSLTESCRGNAGHKCNCDAQNPTFQSDEGVITSARALPITGFNYYGLNFNSQMANVSFGPLICKGAKYFAPGRSCKDLKLQGAAISGYHNLEFANNQIQTAFCDFAKSLNDPNLQRNVAEPERVMFEVSSQHTGNLVLKATNSITYNKVVFSRGPAMVNIDTGIFTAPKPGTYRFFLQTTSGQGEGSINRLTARVNGVKHDSAHTHGSFSSENTVIHFSFTGRLNQGDTVDVIVDMGAIFISSRWGYTVFAGEQSRV